MVDPPPTGTDARASGGPAHAANTVCVCVCTYRRNHLLRRLLSAVVEAQRVSPELDVRALVVDDNPDHAAMEVVDEFSPSLPDRIHYSYSGQRNISAARNMALDVGRDKAAWVALLDDDIEPDPRWLAELMATQRRTGAPFVVGPRRFEVDPAAPSWFTSDFFPGIDLADGEEMEHGSIANVMISSDWLRAHPTVRIDPRYGVTGGEDMVFMDDVMRAGARVVFSPAAMVVERYPLDRCGVRSVLRGSFWLGNNMVLVNRHTRREPGWRVPLRGVKQMIIAPTRPLRRLVHRQPAHWMLAASDFAIGAGMASGAFGLEVAH